MFLPKTDRIKLLAKKFPDVIEHLGVIFDKPTNVYIDFANVKHWQKKLCWHIDLKRLKQLFDSFDTVKIIKFYYGTLENDLLENKYTKTATECGYEVKTKLVKVMNWSIDVSGIDLGSPVVLSNFIAKPFLYKLDVETIEFLNAKLLEMNRGGTKALKVLKCNFDVEIGRDMLLDYGLGSIENFVLWSGDSDFADPIQQLIDDGKKVMIFAVARRISVELGQSKAGIFDIRKIREFICRSKELSTEITADFKKNAL